MATTDVISKTGTATDSMAPVRKNIQVRANAARAFKVFTEGIDSWWPKTHHIGSSHMLRSALEARLGGRCYGEHADGTECDWGRIVEWEPPARFVMAWLIDGEWKHQPDASRCSEVEVTFSPQPDGSTLVQLEHRNFARMLTGGEAMRAGVSGEGGWNGLLLLYLAEAEKTA